MYTNLQQTNFLSDPAPGAVPHPENRFALVREYMCTVFAAKCIHDRAGYVVQDNRSFITVLDECARDNKHGRVRLRDLDLPVPLQPAYLGIAAAGVDGKQCHFGNIFLLPVRMAEPVLARLPTRTTAQRPRSIAR